MNLCPLRSPKTTFSGSSSIRNTPKDNKIILSFTETTFGIGSTGNGGIDPNLMLVMMSLT